MPSSLLSSNRHSKKNKLHHNSHNKKRKNGNTDSVEPSDVLQTAINSHTLHGKGKQYKSPFRDTQTPSNMNVALKKKNHRYPTISATSPYSNMTPQDLGYKNIHPSTKRAKDIPFPVLLIENEIRQDKLFAQLTEKESQLDYLQKSQKLIKVEPIGQRPVSKSKQKDSKLKTNTDKPKATKKTQSSISDKTSIAKLDAPKGKLKKEANTEEKPDIGSESEPESSFVDAVSDQDITENLTRKSDGLAQSNVQEDDQIDTEIEDDSQDAQSWVPSDNVSVASSTSSSSIGEKPMALDLAPKIHTEVVQVYGATTSTNSKSNSNTREPTPSRSTSSFFTVFKRNSNRDQYSNSPSNQRNVNSNLTNIKTSTLREMNNVINPKATPKNPELLVKTRYNNNSIILSKSVYDLVNYNIKVHNKRVKDYINDSNIKYKEKNEEFNNSINELDLKIKSIEKDIIDYKAKIDSLMNDNVEKNDIDIENYHEKMLIKKNQIIKKNDEITYILQSSPPTAAISLDTKDAVTKQSDCTPLIKDWKSEQSKLNEQIDSKVNVIKQLNKNLADVKQKITELSESAKPAPPLSPVKKLVSSPTTNTNTNVSSNAKATANTNTASNASIHSGSSRSTITINSNDELGGDLETAISTMDQPVVNSRQLNPSSSTPAPIPKTPINTELEKSIKLQVSNKLKIKESLKNERLNLNTLISRLKDLTKNYSVKLSSTLSSASSINSMPINSSSETSSLTELNDDTNIRRGTAHSIAVKQLHRSTIPGKYQQLIKIMVLPQLVYMLLQMMVMNILLCTIGSQKKS
ncbi:hypothetical protein TBLA_0C04480 [Henningerozyma blattae CBS 6284]|uniref:Uncharacterized protein n=1 Tax=Henningerozyma blattae (strain ATCC 34711 / CBS 6284 / DSM 70876 / NBRC 10599 / NRRL Y-10934 / UCD 77-7) TaxID=1071380 RepID=I2H1J3_HENB6|nr:hypothetical protein TBLA_0C04480 [Tetrapisispora blattae CBS 6284]CCH60245.1 hypothetical protein TBLA_0C04480 [Tetrapisispora blattae CBS 6284]